MFALRPPAPQIKTLVGRPWFDSLIMACILTNTITLSMDEWPENLEKTRNLDVVNFVLTVIFILEMCLKVVTCERVSSRRTLTAARACSTLTAARA